MANGMTKGFIWSAVERFSVQGVQFVLSIIIARLVSPSDYGLIAMMTIFLAVAQVFIDSGLSQALIHKTDCNIVDYSTAFFMNIIVAVVAYCILFVSSPFISNFYSQPDLILLLRFASLNIIINSFGIVQKTIFTRSVDFKTQAKASLCAVIVGGILGIYLAHCGLGVWALVSQSLISSFINTISLWMLSKWRPVLVFSKDSFKQLYGFGIKLLFTGLISTIYTNIYSLIIGKFYNSSSLGLYNRAYTISAYPSINLVSIISRVVYPIECELQNDNIKLKDSFLKTISISSYIIFPLMLGLATIAKPFVMVVLSSKWEGASEYLTIICFALMWNHIMFLNWQLLSVKGRTDLSLKSEIIKKIFSIIILIVTIPLGIYSMCWGLVLYSFVDMIVVIYFLKDVVNINYKDEIITLLPTFVISCSMSVAILLVNSFIDSYTLQLIIGIIVGITVFSLLSIFSKRWEYFLIIKRLKSII